MREKRHIDELQPATVDEHFQLLLEDKSCIEEKYVELTSHDLPDWYDEDLFKRGQMYIYRHSWSMAVNSICGLIAVLSDPGILQVLTYTGKTDKLSVAFNRYRQTWIYTYAWYRADSTNSNSIWYKSLNVVRWKHWIANQHCLKNGMKGIRNSEMALTQFGFFGFCFLKATELGWSNKPEEREALNHVWRVIGYMIGIPGRLNICRKTAAETTELCQKISDEIFAKHVIKYDEKFLEAVKIMLDAFWYANLYTSSIVTLTFAYSLLGVQYREPLSLYCKLEMKIHECIFYTCHLPIIGSVLKTILTYYVNILSWLMENCPLYAILKFGRENIRINLYPKIIQTCNE